MVKGVFHIATLARNLDETLKLYQSLFGGKASKPKTIPEQGVKTVMLNLGNTSIEILEPLPESNIARVLEKRGEGLHHICLEVDNIDQVLDSLAAKGVELIDKKARRGAEGMVAFVHPKSLKGVLVELCQPLE
jgi:methylmalonyl-CoA epimerase